MPASCFTGNRLVKDPFNALKAVLSLLRSTINHQLIQLGLRHLRAFQIDCLDHLAAISDHVTHQHRVLPAIIWPVLINAAAILILIRQRLEPRTSRKGFTGFRVHPNSSCLHKPRDLGPIVLPPADLRLGCRQPAIAINLAALAALVAVFHCTRTGVVMFSI